MTTSFPEPGRRWTADDNTNTLKELHGHKPRGVLVLLICVPILVRLDCFSRSITMKCENLLGEKQPNFTETSTPPVADTEKRNMPPSLVL